MELQLYYNYAKAARVPERGNGLLPSLCFGFADVIEFRLTVFQNEQQPMDLSHVASWRGGLDSDTKPETEPVARILPDKFDVSEAAAGVIHFTVDCNTKNFMDRIKADTAGFLEIYGNDGDDRQVVRIRIPAWLEQVVDPSGDHCPLEVPPDAVRSLNGLRGNLLLVDEDGNEFPADGQKLKVPSGSGFAGTFPIADPVIALPVADEVWGDCRYLDAAFRQLSFRGRVRGLRRVRLELVSINAAVAGNIVLVPIINGVESEALVLPVGAEPTDTTFGLEVASGRLILRRDTSDERDTLRDSSGAITAVILSVILEVQYA